MSADVTILDYGVGNLFSIAHALDHVGAKVLVTSDPQRAKTADRLILPGVGAFASGMKVLKEQGMDEAIHEFVLTERPFLGICLGMQMMLDTSEEFGNHTGLGLIPGKVVSIPDTTKDGDPHKIPHIGWSRIIPVEEGHPWKGSLLDGMKPGSRTYFVHSFTPVPDKENHRLSDAYYNGRRLSAVIVKDNLYGTQFHPERSGPVGLGILKRFMEL